jgi:hypothetical protein
MQCALVAMLASGFRPSTNALGHHQTMIQSLPLTIGLANDRWILLDALRKKRNQNDYAGPAWLMTRRDRQSLKQRPCCRKLKRS